MSRFIVYFPWRRLDFVPKRWAFLNNLNSFFFLRTIETFFVFYVMQPPGYESILHKLEVNTMKSWCDIFRVYV